MCGADPHIGSGTAAVYFGYAYDAVVQTRATLIILQLPIPPELAWHLPCDSPVEGEPSVQQWFA